MGDSKRRSELLEFHDSIKKATKYVARLIAEPDVLEEDKLRIIEYLTKVLEKAGAIAGSIDKLEKVIYGDDDKEELTRGDKKIGMFEKK